MVGAAAMENTDDIRLRGEVIGDLGRGRLLGAHPHRHGLQALEHHPGIERAHGGAGLAQVLLQMFLHVVLGAEYRAAETAALPVDVLGGRVDDDVGTVLKRPLAERRRKHVVDDDDGADLLGELADSADVDQLQRRVGRCLEEEQLGVGPYGLLPGVQIAAIDERRGDAVAGGQCLDDIAAGAEQSTRRDDMIAGLDVGHYCRVDGGHAARRGTRFLGALQQPHALFEHGDGRIAEAAVLEAGILVLEARLGLLGAGVDEALRQEHGFGGFAELRAERAAVHELGFGRPLLGGCRSIVVARHARSCGLVRPRKIPASRRAARKIAALKLRGAHGPFSELFYVAASRPAK